MADRRGGLTEYGGAQMAITKLDAVLEAIQNGKTNDEIRDEIDGRLSDNRLNKLRAHPDIRGGNEVTEVDREEIDREVEKIFSPGLPAKTEPKSTAQLRQTGAEYKGLLGYYVDDRAVTFWADGIEIDSDQLDELVEEIKEIIRIHREFASVRIRGEFPKA